MTDTLPLYYRMRLAGVLLNTAKIVAKIIVVKKIEQNSTRTQT